MILCWFWTKRDHCIFFIKQSWKCCIPVTTVLGWEFCRIKFCLIEHISLYILLHLVVFRFNVLHHCIDPREQYIWSIWTCNWVSLTYKFNTSDNLIQLQLICNLWNMLIFDIQELVVNYSGKFYTTQINLQCNENIDFWYSKSGNKSLIMVGVYRQVS